MEASSFFPPPQDSFLTIPHSPPHRTTPILPPRCATRNHERNINMTMMAAGRDATVIACVIYLRTPINHDKRSPCSRAPTDEPANAPANAPPISTGSVRCQSSHDEAASPRQNRWPCGCGDIPSRARSASIPLHTNIGRTWTCPNAPATFRILVLRPAFPADL